ncbi:MarR family transcriptional regulator [Nocardioides islandensis]|jgi:DNA-binding MarR family transcriptional regulator|uniref:MarR family transcriptional regulator n=1 Tax=Nocardioides islandensis TaxID=433663 RepID=A0A930VDZ3_9ACTN|nr:MarR family transcriptional regulator [Nocardioides islandensis]MBF4763861.1 MarR family transcriptional regulator [Nocardioides islandensis]
MSDGPGANLGLLLFIPYRAMESAVLEEVRRQGFEMPINQARVFQRIGPAGSRLGELAEASQVSKQTIGSIVDQLESAGYVERVPDPDDARARLVVVAERGRQAIEAGLPVLHQVEARWREHLGVAKYEQLRRILADLVEITDPFA